MSSLALKQSDLLKIFDSLSPSERKSSIDKLLAYLPTDQLRVVFESLKISLAQDFLTILPDNIIYKILSHLTPQELIQAGSTSKRWHKYIFDDRLWISLCEKYQFIHKPFNVNYFEFFKESYFHDKAWTNANYFIKTDMVKHKESTRAGQTRILFTAYCHSDNTVLTCDDHDTIILWKVNEKDKQLDEVRYILKPDLTGAPTSIALSRTKYGIYSTKALDIYDKSSGKRDFLIMHSADNIASNFEYFSLMEDSTAVIVNDFDLKFYNLSTSSYKRCEPSFDPEELSSAFSNNHMLALGSWNGQVDIWPLTTDPPHLQKPYSIISHTEVVNTIKIFENYLITGGGDGKVVVFTWRLDNNGVVSEPSIYHVLSLDSDILKLAVTNKYLAAACNTEVKVYEWKDFTSGNVTSNIKSSNGNIMGTIRALEFSQGGRLIVASSQRRVSVWSCTKNKLLSVVHHNPVLVGNIYVGMRHLVIVSNDRPGALSFVLYNAKK